MKSRRKFLLVVAVVLGIVLGSFGIAYAITNGQPDGDGHPYVGAVNNGVYFCSGAAISPTVFVTAAHCFFYSGEPVWVTFDPEGRYADPPPVYHSGTWYPHPDWCPGCAPGSPGDDTHDVAVVIFDEPVTLPRYAELPTEGLVDTLPMNSDVTIVGYGLQGFNRGGGRPSPDIDYKRYYAPALLVASNHPHSDEYIKLTANPAKGKGGVCLGDSGGPNLLGDTDTILAITSYGTNSNCAGVTYSNRIDIAYALEFINGFTD
jgi:hypothetical protein